MVGSIRLMVGMMIMLGAVGTIEVDADANLLLEVTVAILGALIAQSGILAMKRENKQ